MIDKLISQYRIKEDNLFHSRNALKKPINLTEFRGTFNSLLKTEVSQEKNRNKTLNSSSSLLLKDTQDIRQNFFTNSNVE